MTDAADSGETGDTDRGATTDVDDTAATTDAEWQSTWHSLRELLGSKWSLHVLRLLSTGSYGFNEAKRRIDGMTATMLSRRLKELECHGFVDRTVRETTPPTTAYRLTDRGSEFARLLREMEDLVDREECDRTRECATAPDDRCVTVGACGR